MEINRNLQNKVEKQNLVRFSQKTNDRMGKIPLATLLAIFCFLGLSLSAVASPTNPAKVDEQIPAKLMVALSYAFIWTAVFVFIVLQARRLRKLEKQITELDTLIQQKNMNLLNTSASNQQPPSTIAVNS